MPSLLYYLRRVTEQSFRETLTQARALASGHVRSVIQPGCDRLFQRAFTTDDLLKVAAFPSEAALAHHLKSRDWPALELGHPHAIGEADAVLTAGPQRPWHLDPQSGFVWDSSLHYRNVPLSPAPGVDIKRPWELSRCHHLVTMGLAYRETGNERYPLQFAGEVRNWIEQNPVRYGVNWVSAMEAGIRSVNWSWAFALMRSAVSVDSNFITVLLKSLSEHAQFIKANLEYREAWVQGKKQRLNSNHYICDLAGLLTIALLFPELRLGKEAQFAQRELEIEIVQQTTDDGVDYEHSTAYHRFVHELFGYCFELLEKCDRHVNSDALLRLTRMESFSNACLHPDGALAQIGDNDSGRLLSGFSMSSVRTTHSEAFPAAGFYSMRGPDTHVLISAARVGMHGFGSHSHNDVLSCEYWHGGLAWIVDPGTYAYLPDVEARNWFRSTTAHNTVRVDREEIRPFHAEAIFQMMDQADVRVLQWHTDSCKDVLEAEHTGYDRLPKGVRHRRLFELDKIKGRFSMVDSLDGTGEHLFEWFFQIHPDVRVERSGTGAEYLLFNGRQRVSLQIKTDLGELTSAPGWYSPRYGIRQRATTVVARTRTNAPTIATITIEPC